MGPSARSRIKLEPHAVPDSNWEDPRNTEGGDTVVTDHLKEQAEKSRKRVTVLKRKQLVRRLVLLKSVYNNTYNMKLKIYACHFRSTRQYLSMRLGN